MENKRTTFPLDLEKIKKKNGDDFLLQKIIIKKMQVTCKMIKSFLEIIPELILIITSGTFIFYLYNESTDNQTGQRQDSNIDIKIKETSSDAILENKEEFNTTITRRTNNSENNLQNKSESDEWWPFVTDDSTEYTDWVKL